MPYDLSLSAPLPFTLTEGGGTYSAVGAAHNGVALVADDTTVWRSTDGENWSIALTYPVGQWGSKKTLLWLSGKAFLRLEDSDLGTTAWVSADGGVTWGSVANPPYSFSAKSVANGYLYVVDDDTSATYRTSDLTTFEAVTGFSSPQMLHASYGNGVWLISEDGALYRSTDGVTFSLTQTDVFYNREPTVWHPELSRFFAVSGNSSSPFQYPLISSADGLTWVAHDTSVVSPHSPWQPDGEYFPPDDWWALDDLLPIPDGVLLRMASGDSLHGLYLYNYADADGLYILSRWGETLQVTGSNSTLFDSRVLLLGNLSVEDPSQSLSLYGEPTGIWLQFSPPAPAPEPVFWTNFTLSYEVP
ncbi:MAG: hypothetical protein RBT67_02800 [Thauera sp.]|jgi:hypothetical protein|nr:hypothetical protein [Thauera sp.]